MTERPVVFDLYGTLLRIDALQARVARHTVDADRFVQAWRAKQIGYTWTASLMKTYRSFDDHGRRARLHRRNLRSPAR